jgi:hypothetical protein
MTHTSRNKLVALNKTQAVENFLELTYHESCNVGRDPQAGDQLLIHEKVLAERGKRARDLPT